MMIVNRRYEFRPPNGQVPITVLALQDYSPGQTQKVDIWKVDPPAQYATAFGDHLEFSSYATLIARLATLFCRDDQALAAERLVSVGTGTERDSV